MSIHGSIHFTAENDNEKITLLFVPLPIVFNEMDPYLKFARRLLQSWLTLLHCFLFFFNQTIFSSQNGKKKYSWMTTRILSSIRIIIIFNLMGYETLRLKGFDENDTCSHVITSVQWAILGERFITLIKVFRNRNYLIFCLSNSAYVNNFMASPKR